MPTVPRLGKRKRRFFQTLETDSRKEVLAKLRYLDLSTTTTALTWLEEFRITLPARNRQEYGLRQVQ